jgi:hypothetical protein
MPLLSSSQLTLPLVCVVMDKKKIPATYCIWTKYYKENATKRRGSI